MGGSVFKSRTVQMFPVDHLSLLEYFDPLFRSTHCRAVSSELAWLSLVISDSISKWPGELGLLVIMS